ncbi:MAG: hypothetical protein RIS32_888 [Actinomycetota bacterium]
MAYGYGISTIAKDGSILDTYFHQLGLGTAEASRVDLANLEGADNEREITRSLVKTEIELDKPPASVSDAYLRLHLLSHRLVKPHGLSLEGIFSILNNVIWTSHGPCAIAGFDQVRLKLRAKYGYLAIYGVDKFPRMLDYVVPEGVRVANADRVRLGAYLSPGTTVMHEGFVNFNAGTLGASMVEGRISAGVVVDDGSDIGGGASIMGTLSGGEPIQDLEFHSAMTVF